MKRYMLYISAVILCLTQIWFSCSFKQDNDWFDGYALIPEVNDIPDVLDVPCEGRIKVSQKVYNYVDSLMNDIYPEEDAVPKEMMRFKLFKLPFNKAFSLFVLASSQPVSFDNYQDYFLYSENSDKIYPFPHGLYQYYMTMPKMTDFDTFSNRPFLNIDGNSILIKERTHNGTAVNAITYHYFTFHPEKGVELEIPVEKACIVYGYEECLVERRLQSDTLFAQIRCPKAGVEPIGYSVLEKQGDSIMVKEQQVVDTSSFNRKWLISIYGSMESILY